MTVDELLHQDAINYTNLGTDSTEEERAEVKKKSKRIYNKIAKLNPALGKSLLDAMDNINNER